MMSGWDVYENPEDAKLSKNTSGIYFSGEDDGHQVKKGWVYTVPSYLIDEGAYNDDEEKYMYFNNSGDIVMDQFKKINGKYYAFGETGIMKTGVILWRTKGSGPKFVGKLDLDWATGEDLAKRGKLHLGKTDDGKDKLIYVDTTGRVSDKLNVNSVDIDNEIKLHLFGEDGARKTGMNTIEFSDENYTLNTVGSSGDKGTGVFAKKYYSLGILLKASQDIRYGIYQTATMSMLVNQNGGENWDSNIVDFRTELVNGNYLVLTTSGAKQKGNRTAKKDADGNYWMISEADSSLKGIYTVGIKESNNLSGFKTKTMDLPLSANRQSNNGIINWTNYSDNAYTTADLLDTAITEKLFSQDIIDGILTEDGIQSADLKWTLHRSGQGTENPGPECYFTCNYNGPCFQSDYGEGSNKWIPFGMLDNSLKTATFDFVNCTPDSASDAYALLKLNNDYFTNCYWENN